MFRAQADFFQIAYEGDILGWNSKEARFPLEGQVLFTQRKDANWKKFWTFKMTSIPALLCVLSPEELPEHRRAWMEVILTVQTFFQFASFGWVNKTRPSKGNRASSELHPSISNAVWKIKFVMNELWRVRVAQIFSLQNEDSKWVAKIQLLILQIPAILDTNNQHFYMFLQKKSIKSCFY